MKLFKKVALVAAVTAASGSAFALEAMTDEALSQKTGQDGITIRIAPSDAGIRISKLYIHDNDGLTKQATNTAFGEFAGADYEATQTAAISNNLGGTETAGAIVVYGEGAGTAADPFTGAVDKAGTATNKGLIIQGGNITVDVDTDGGNASTDAQNNAFINARVKMSGDTHIGIGKVGVGSSKNPTAAASDAVNYTGVNTRELRGTQTPNQILGAMSVKLSGSEMNIQMGAQPQGAMVIMNSTINNGLTIENLEVVDNNGFAGSTTQRPTTVADPLVDQTNLAPAAVTTGGQKGSLLVKKLHISDYDTTAGATAKLTLRSRIDIDQRDGIVMSMEDATDDGMYIYMKDVGIGTGDSKFAQYHRTVAANATTPANLDFTNVTESIIGDVEVVGLTTGGSTISIAGH